MPFVLTSNLKTDTMCRFRMASAGQWRWWKLAGRRVEKRPFRAALSAESQGFSPSVDMVALLFRGHRRR